MSLNIELAKASGLKASSFKNNKGLKKLVKQISNISEDAWEDLSEDAQLWYNEAAVALNDKKDIPEIVEPEIVEPEVEEEPEVQEEPKKDKKSKKEKGKKDKKSKKDKKGKGKEEKAPKEEKKQDKKAASGVKLTVHAFVTTITLIKPDITLDELMEEVTEAGYKIKEEMADGTRKTAVKIAQALEERNLSVKE